MITNENQPKKRGRPKGSISKLRLKPPKARAKKEAPPPKSKVGRPVGAVTEPTELYCFRVPCCHALRSRLHRLALLVRAEGQGKVTASDLARSMLLERIAAMEDEWSKKIRQDLIRRKQHEIC
jgi:hypothetical protein